MRKIVIQPRPLSPGELAYQQRAAKWYTALQAKRPKSANPIPIKDPEDPKVRFNSTGPVPPRSLYGAIMGSEWSPENDV